MLMLYKSLCEEEEARAAKVERCICEEEAFADEIEAVSLCACRSNFVSQSAWHDFDSLAMAVASPISSASVTYWVWQWPPHPCVMFETHAEI